MCFFFQQKFTRFCFFVFFSFLRLKLHFSQNSISLQRVKSKIVFYTAFLCRFILWLLSQELLINLANSVSLYHFAEHLGHDRREAKTTIRHPNILLGCLALTDLMVGLGRTTPSRNYDYTFYMEGTIANIVTSTFHLASLLLSLSFPQLLTWF